MDNTQKALIEIRQKIDNFRTQNNIPCEVGDDEYPDPLIPRFIELIEWIKGETFI